MKPGFSFPASEIGLKNKQRKQYVSNQDIVLIIVLFVNEIPIWMFELDIENIYRHLSCSLT